VLDQPAVFGIHADYHRVRRERAQALSERTAPEIRCIPVAGLEWLRLEHSARTPGRNRLPHDLTTDDHHPQRHLRNPPPAIRSGV
jgi:hypothetical protein